MKLTEALKQHMREHFGVPADASDEQFRKAIGDKLGSGELPYEKIKELNGTRSALVDAILEKGAVMILTQKLKKWLIDNRKVAANAGDESFKTACAVALQDGSLSHEKFVELLEELKPDAAELVRGFIREELKGITMKPTSPNPAAVFAGDRIDVLPGSERYNTARAKAKHAKTGQPVFVSGREVELPSELDKARCGIFLKKLAKKAGFNVKWDDHDEEMLNDLVEKESFVGQIGDHFHEGRLPERVKASLLNDSASGGEDLVPTITDSMLLAVLVLSGELLPHVTIRDVGAVTTKTPTIGRPTIGWNTAEGTAITPFDCTDLINNISTSVFPVHCAVEVGRDLLMDSLPDLGGALLSLVGEQFAVELDAVIAGGDGSSQPLGLLNASSVNTVPTSTVTSVPATGGGGTITWSDVENLMAALDKPYRNRALNPMYVGNDTNYFRLRGIPVATGWNSRLHGTSYADYMISEFPYKVQNDIANTTVMFVAMRRYWLLRRQGFEIRWETGGRELTLKNMALLIARGRFGGRLMDGNAAAKLTGLPA